MLGFCLVVLVGSWVMVSKLVPNTLMLCLFWHGCSFSTCRAHTENHAPIVTLKACICCALGDSEVPKGRWATGEGRFSDAPVEL